MVLKHTLEAIVSMAGSGLPTGISGKLLLLNYYNISCYKTLYYNSIAQLWQLVNFPLCFTIYLV